MSTDPSPTIPFAQRLQERLRGIGPSATQSWLAEKTGLDRSLISRLLRGERSPTLVVLQCLAPVLQVDLLELVRGTDAEDKLQEAASHVRRADYETAVAKVIEYEQTIRELRTHLRNTSDALSDEKATRKSTEQALAQARDELTVAVSNIANLEALCNAREKEIERYQDALARAISRFSALQEEVAQLEKSLGDAQKSSRVSAILAGVAAVTSVATLSHFLGEDDDDQEDPD